MKEIVKFNPNEPNPLINAWKEVQGIKVEDTDTSTNIYEKFYDIMRKYGIKQGTQSHNPDGTNAGVLMSNAEWIICHACLKQNLEFHFTFKALLDSPDDLGKY